MKVIGVVNDMLMESPFAGIRPAVFMLSYANAQIISMKLNPAMSASQALHKIEPVFKAFRPESLFEVQFADEEFNKKFMNEVRVGKLASFFAALALFISCLGLLGLAIFTTNLRTKEIGVRKVLGATVTQIVTLLSTELVMLILLSFVVATPIAWYVMYKCMQDFADHTPISWWIFALSGAGMLLTALFTLSFQTIKAAIANPVKSLKTE